MFSALGDLVAPRDDDQEEAEGSEEEGEGSSAPLNFWSMASALRDSVKQRTAELAQSLQETDWRKELGAFQKGLKEDSADTITKTREAVEHLPTVVEQFSAKDAGAVLQAKAKEAQQQLEKAGKSLGSYGQKLLLGTSELFDQIKEAIQNEMAFDGPQDGAGRRIPSKRQLVGTPGAKYSRFEADVSAMQRDSSTYCDEPEDEEDYAAWLEGFNLEAKRPDIEALIAANTFMAELQARIVPLIVEYDAFWTRYFYRLHKLQQKHDQFVQLTQRANQEEEDLGWGSDEEGQNSTPPKPEQAEPPSSQPGSTLAPAAAGEAEGKQRQEQEQQAVEAGGESAGAGQTEEGVKEEAGGAPAAAAADAPATASPTLSEDEVRTVSTGSEASQISGGTPERWAVVSSPRKAQHAAAEEARAEAGEAKEEKEAAAPGGKLTDGAAPPAAKPKAPEASGSREAAPSAAAGAAAAAAPAAAAAVAAMPAAKAAAAAAAKGEEEDLSDFDVDGGDAAAGGDDAVDEDWGDEDWE